METTTISAGVEASTATPVCLYTEQDRSVYCLLIDSLLIIQLTNVSEVRAATAKKAVLNKMFSFVQEYQSILEFH